MTLVSRVNEHAGTLRGQLVNVEVTVDEVLRSVLATDERGAEHGGRRCRLNAVATLSDEPHETLNFRVKPYDEVTIRDKCS